MEQGGVECRLINWGECPSHPRPLALSIKILGWVDWDLLCILFLRAKAIFFLIFLNRAGFVVHVFQAGELRGILDFPRQMGNFLRQRSLSWNLS